MEVSPMPKLYFGGIVAPPLTPKDIVGFPWYTRDAEKAGMLDTREGAEFTCHKCEEQHYAFTPSKGDRHICAGFKVEERTGRFMVFCEAPL
jgi:hypothetical protein